MGAVDSWSRLSIGLVGSRVSISPVGSTLSVVGTLGPAGDSLLVSSFSLITEGEVVLILVQGREGPVREGGSCALGLSIGLVGPRMSIGPVGSTLSAVDPLCPSENSLLVSSFSLRIGGEVMLIPVQGREVLVREGGSCVYICLSV